MGWLDAVVLVILAVSALEGWRTGGARQVIFLGGLWIGLWIGAEFALPAASLATGTARGVVAVAVIVAAAVAVAVPAGLVGRRVARVVHHVRVGALDAAAGAFLAVTGTLVALWLIGNLAAASRTAAIDRAVQGSRVLRGVDTVLPPLPVVFARVESFLASQGSPVVFVDIHQEQTVAVPLPSRPAVEAEAARVGPSAVRVTGPACGGTLAGSGFVVAPHLVVTDAHVVAGDADPRVVDARGTYPATTVRFDPRLDLAVLRVPGLEAPALALYTGPVPTGTGTVVVGYSRGGVQHAAAAAITATLDATGLDIYDRSVVVREVHQLHATVPPASSGAPVVSLGAGGRGEPPGGSVVGVVFARSPSTPTVGYALATHAVEEAVRRAERSASAVGTGGCTP